MFIFYFFNICLSSLVLLCFKLQFYMWLCNVVSILERSGAPKLAVSSQDPNSLHIYLIDKLLQPLQMKTDKNR